MNIIFKLLTIYFLLSILITSKLESQIEENKTADPKPQEIIQLMEITPPKPQRIKLSSIPGKKISFIWDQNTPIITDIKTCNEICNKHFNASINCTYKEAIKNSFIKDRFKKKKWILENKKLAVPAKGHKVVFQNTGDGSYVFRVTSNRSLLVDIWKIEKQADQYYDCYTLRTPYFLVKYKHREIPTYLPDMTLKLLAKWEQEWLKQNHITKEYFDKHIFVYNVQYDFWDKIGINEPFTFIVDYYYEVDWAKTRLKNRFVPEKFGQHTLKYLQTKITHVEPIESVISIQEVVDKVSSVSDSVYMNLNNIKLSHNKHKDNATNEFSTRFKIEFQADIDPKNNSRIIGKIYLDTGEVDYKKTVMYIID